MISETHNTIPMLTEEQYKRYRALQRRLHGNPMLEYSEYSEYIKLHTQFQNSIHTQPTVSNELKLDELDVGYRNINYG